MLLSAIKFPTTPSYVNRPTQGLSHIHHSGMEMRPDSTSTDLHTRPIYLSLLRPCMAVDLPFTMLQHELFTTQR